MTQDQAKADICLIQHFLDSLDIDSYNKSNVLFELYVLKVVQAVGQVCTDTINQTSTYV